MQLKFCLLFCIKRKEYKVLSVVHVGSERHFLILNIYTNYLSCVDENFCRGAREAGDHGWLQQTAQLVFSLCLAPAFSHGSDDNWYVVHMRSNM